MSIEENLSSIATSLRDISVSLATIANHLTKPQVIYKPAPLSEDAPAPAATVTVTEPLAPQTPEKAAPKSEPAATGAPVVTPAAKPATAGTVPYSDVQKAVLALVAAKGRDAAMRVFEPFGLASAKEAKPEQYGALLAALVEAATK